MARRGDGIYQRGSLLCVMGAAMFAGCALSDSPDKLGERLRRECVSIVNEVAGDWSQQTRESVIRRCIVARGGLGGVL